jgi:hypothetical protein
MPIQLRSATKADIVAIARVGSAAFDPATDVILRNIFPTHLQSGGRLEEDTQTQWLIRRNTAALDNPDAVLMVAEDGAEVVGFSLWIAPHCEKGTTKPTPVFPPNMDKEAAVEVRNILFSQCRGCVWRRWLKKCVG